MRLAITLARIGIGWLLLASISVHAEDWWMYGRDLKHSFSNPDSAIKPSNVFFLKEVWFRRTGDVVSASPAVVNGVVYVGSWDGFFYALDAHSGSLIWKFQVDCQKTVVPVPEGCHPPQTRATSDGGIITSSAAVIGGNVYFGAGKKLYSLRASDGHPNWKTPTVICGNPDDPRPQGCQNDANDPTRIFSSPAVSGGRIFIGHTADGAPGYRGGFEAVDAASGKVVWRFETDPKLDSRGNPIGGGINRGCGSVWSSAAVDPDRHLVYFGTGDCQQDAPPPYHEAIIALDTGTGTPKWVFRPRATDKCDFDFGASPNIIDFGVDGHYVGLGGKDGTYYLLDRSSGGLIWAKNVVFGGSIGGFFGGAAFDGEHIFSSTAVGDFEPKSPTKVCTDPPAPGDTLTQDPSMHALNVANGSRYWERPFNYSFGASTLARGVVFSGFLGIPGFLPPALNAYAASGPLHGLLLKIFNKTGQVNSAAVPVGRMLFVTTGNVTDGSGGGVHAFALPSWVP
jgi:polyvinyl alcohol dehydrogenase (cytochrome)